MSGLLIAAIAGRMLAASAQRGGYKVAVLDLFNDLDTRQIAPHSQKVPGHEQGLARFSGNALLEAARVLAPGDVYSGVVYGSGFEDDTELLRELTLGRRLYGNSMAVIERIKDPRQFFALLDELTIPHPDIAFSPPLNSDGWLAKKIGGSGGAHVVAVSRIRGDADGRYYQRYCAGTNYSVSFLANGKRALIVGFNEPWSLALGDWPYCYLGAINHANLPIRIVDRIQGQLDRLVNATGLLGLNGLDFIVAGDDYFVIEVNPRPSGTLDLYDEDCAKGLFHWHLQASDGILPETLFLNKTIRAHAVVYTLQPFTLSNKIHWPDWCSDIPEPGTAFAARMPVCMIHAEGVDHDSVKKLIHMRRKTAWHHIQKQAE
ncbi:MAG: ATP-grasp domain-containing protein [Burkholderiales bacterium]